MPRLFIAIDLTAPTQTLLRDLAQPALGGRWIDHAQMHLTLRFLGSVNDDAVAPLTEALGAVVAPRFQLGIAGVGVFPAPAGRKPARVLWAGVAPAGPVAALKATIDDVLGPDPESAGRGYSPHVTLARFAEPPGPGLGEFLAAHAELRGEPFLVADFVLYESRTLPSGPVYTARARFPLSLAAAHVPNVPFPHSLCHACQHHRLVASARSTFIRCAALPDKYPRQPVLTCPVFYSGP